MRQILVDHARHRSAVKHGGEMLKLSLDEAINFFQERDVNLIRLDDALIDLERIDQQACRVVEFRFFGGLTIDETAEALGVSTATINRDWRTAKLWLLREISGTVTNDG